MQLAGHSPSVLPNQGSLWQLPSGPRSMQRLCYSPENDPARCTAELIWYPAWRTHSSTPAMLSMLHTISIHVRIPLAEQCDDT